ncbi:cysteine desulfurase family protein [Hydrogenophaga pseudoflava]|uniref:cysteine desulfurase family protein n=1 Tax=Hydrogenophaga pseudoflava TaxID=47421 RepID=UPI0027E556F0|nr:cysteine desulfurase family protein [Hydrogenophaga pseudoflava]MDQ7743895.1 cysteine desulfurase family protein [Hydrogenophaga pseudoflava]
MIYLDHHATTPPLQAVIDAMAAVMAGTWANASSKHGPGQAASRVLAGARSVVAQALGCKPAEVVFTSGATEANHLAVRGLLAAAPAGRRRVLFSAVEHAGHLKLARDLAEAGVPVDFLPVQPDGTLDLDAATRLIRDDVAVVSLMAANNETGVLMPVAGVAALAAAAGARLHVDATQWIGKRPFRFADWGADAVSFSAHKFNGPKGVGALLLRQGVAVRPPVPGSQERGRRGGTENLPAIVGLATALEALGDLDAEAARQAMLRDRLEAAVLAELPGVHIWSRAVPRLPGVSFLRVGGLEADVVLGRLERLGFAASSGAACSSSGSEPSHVLRAMGVPHGEALGAIRLSLGRTTTDADVDALIAALPTLRSLLPTVQPAAA